MYPNASFPLWLASLILLTLCPRSRSRATILTCEAAAGVHVAFVLGHEPLLHPAPDRRLRHARARRDLLERQLGCLGVLGGIVSRGCRRRLSGDVAIARESKVAAGVAT